jgi:hypothetical protein
MKEFFLKKNLMRIIICGIGLVFIVLFGVFLYIKKDRSFDAMPNLPERSVPENWSEHVKIGIIGNSWVAGKKLDQPLKNALLNLEISAEIISSGQPGAKSRLIYRNLLADESQPYSSHKLLMDEHLDYLVVVAGVNDTSCHVGKKFYAHHMLCIIKAAQMRGLYPIIVEVPEYGIEDMPRGTLKSLVKEVMYRVLFDQMRVNVISSYRKELKEQISKLKKDELTVVPFNSFIEDYSKKKFLYKNPSHLNQEGGKQLGCIIAEYIKKTHTKRLQQSKLKKLKEGR